MTTISKPTANPLRLLAIAALMVSLSPIAWAADWPTFKAGNWSFERTLAGMTTTSDSVLEVLSDESYAITVDSTVDGNKTHEVLQARRLGDCPR